MIGALVIIFSALRFRELSKRFFAIRIIFFLALTDVMAAAFNILGALADVMAAAFSIIGVSLDQGALSQWARGEWSQQLLVLCEVQAIGLLYFNLASILWTSCFAFTLYRDVVPSYRRHALRKYEPIFHLLCWPLPAVLAGSVAVLGSAGLDASSESGTWCSLGIADSTRYLICFYVPLLAGAQHAHGHFACARARSLSMPVHVYIMSMVTVCDGRCTCTHEREAIIRARVHAVHGRVHACMHRAAALPLSPPWLPYPHGAQPSPSTSSRTRRSYRTRVRGESLV